MLELEDANSTEFDPKTENAVISLMPDQEMIEEMGGTMRLGLYPCMLAPDSHAGRAYAPAVGSRNGIDTVGNLTTVTAVHVAAAGMCFSGLSPDGRLLKIAELAPELHPWMLGTQFHPEFRSRPHRPHPFSGLSYRPRSRQSYQPHPVSLDGGGRRGQPRLTLLWYNVVPYLRRQGAGAIIMSGHSKWATIKRKKGANDAQRGKIFTKFAREIQLAAREGADPNFNFRLRLIIDKAKAQNMPKDNIERAVKRGAGVGEDGTQLEESTYEGYGPHGVALLIQTVTDNKNRTVGDLRRTLTRGGGSLGESGSVGWLFESKGLISIPMAKLDQDRIFELALESGAGRRPVSRRHGRGLHGASRSTGCASGLPGCPSSH